MIALISFCCLIHLDNQFKVESAERQLSDNIAASIRKELDEKAIVIKQDSDDQMLFWFRKAIPGKASADQIKNGLTYRELLETTVIGVVEFKKTFTDFRKQEIAAGLYTLRLGFQPDTGDHKDTAPHTEFLLLAPVKNDQSLDETDLKSVITMSLKATGADHAGVMLLFPNHQPKADPEIEKKDNSIQILKIRREVMIDQKSVTIGFGITIAGSYK